MLQGTLNVCALPTPLGPHVLAPPLDVCQPSLHIIYDVSTLQEDILSYGTGCAKLTQVQVITARHCDSELTSQEQVWENSSAPNGMMLTQAGTGTHVQTCSVSAYVHRSCVQGQARLLTSAFRDRPLWQATEHILL